MKIRAADSDDLAAIAAIQAASPEASQWEPASYLDYDCLVAVEDDHVAGFLVSRQTAPGAPCALAVWMRHVKSKERKQESCSSGLLAATEEARRYAQGSGLSGVPCTLNASH